MKNMASSKKDSREESSIPRPSIQTLSDLIFGLALSIGAISLLGQQLSDITQIIESLSIFALGFYLLVNVWYRYASIMKALPSETSSLITLNLLLLFFVAIEPYLLNISISASANSIYSIKSPVSQLYAIDFGSIYVILAFFLQQLATEEKKLGKVKFAQRYDRRRTFSLLVAAVFYVSVIPFFGSINISYFSLRQLMWLSFLPIGLALRVGGWLDN